MNVLREETITHQEETTRKLLNYPKGMWRLVIGCLVAQKKGSYDKWRPGSQRPCWFEERMVACTSTEFLEGSVSVTMYVLKLSWLISRRVP